MVSPSERCDAASIPSNTYNDPSRQSIDGQSAEGMVAEEYLYYGISSVSHRHYMLIAGLSFFRDEDGYLFVLLLLAIINNRKLVNEKCNK